jgi:hypothetical protein
MASGGANGCQRRHVEAPADLCASAEDGALAAHTTGIAIERGYTDQGGDFPARQTPQFGHFRDQAGGGGRADAAHAAEQLGKIGVVGVDVPGQFRLDFIELGAEGDDHGLDALACGGVTDRQAVLLGNAYGDELPAAGHQRLQFLLLRRGQGTDETRPLGMTGEHLGEFSQGQGFDAVGLGQMAHGLGEIACLAWIDDGHGKAGGLAGTSQVTFETAGRLHDDQVDGLSRQLGEQGLLAAVVVGESLDTPAHA